MNILTDAEYRLLSEDRKLAYWRARYEEANERGDVLRAENDKLVLVIKRIKEALATLQ